VSTIKLYLPYGTFGNANDRKRGWYSPYAEIILHWFVVGRQEPLAPYESLILGYSRLIPATRATAERTVNEFFSEAEFHLLRDYLRLRHSKDLRTAVLCAPVPSIHPDANTRTGMMRPFYPSVTHAEIVFAASATSDMAEMTDAAEVLEPVDALLDGDEAEVGAADVSAVSDLEPALAPAARPTVEAGFCRLSEEEGYNLPFAVWGYYSVAARPDRGIEAIHEIAAPRPFTPSSAIRNVPSRIGSPGRSPR
jgi:hypothetical protein